MKSLVSLGLLVIGLYLLSDNPEQVDAGNPPVVEQTKPFDYSVLSILSPVDTGSHNPLCKCEVCDCDVCVCGVVKPLEQVSQERVFLPETIHMRSPPYVSRQADCPGGVCRVPSRSGQPILQGGRSRGQFLSRIRGVFSRFGCRRCG